MRAQQAGQGACRLLGFPPAMFPLTLGSSLWLLLPVTLLERTPISRHGDTRPGSPLSPSAKGREKDLLEANASSHTVSSKENDTGQNMGQSDMEWNMGRRGMGWNAGQSDLGQKGKGWNVRSSDTGQNDMGQIKDEEIKTSISKVEALPSPLGAPPETPPPLGSALPSCCP